MDTLAAPGAVTAYLELIATDADRPAVFPLHDEAVIGRDPQDALASDHVVCLPEHTVSRRHARIRRRGAQYFIEDLHSRNGTFVLGERLAPGTWHPLHDGDELTLSSAQLVFHSLLLEPAEQRPACITKFVDATRYAQPPALPRQDVAGFEQPVLRLHAMAQVSIALGAVVDRATLTDRIMNLIFDLFPQAERAFVLLRGQAGDTPVPVAARRRDGALLDPCTVRISHTIVDEVLQRKRAVLSTDTLADRHYAAQDSIVAQAILSVMCVPLIIGDEVLGLIQLDTSSDPHAFQEADLEILSGVCAETAVALKNFQLYADIKGLLDGFVSASVQAIEERDPVTAGHSFRVAQYADLLAQALPRAADPALRAAAFNAAQLREIHYAALLHDFGKVGVREHILRKEKKLHHADMRLLEQRFRYARACLERQAYRELTERHLREDWSQAEFRRQKESVDTALRAEDARLDTFLTAIHAANEPAIAESAISPALAPIRQYACSHADGRVFHLLDDDELAALHVARGCLTTAERQQIEAHVADSYSFLILIPWTRDLAGVPAIAHAHHEKLDGSGYPMGLHGPQISLQTRILTICDIYDALTARDRPYKRAVPPEQALALMSAECAAGHLDERLFKVFVESHCWEEPCAA